MMPQVRLSKFAQKQILKLPKHIQMTLRFWVEVIEKKGTSEMRRIPGFHDEPLKGDRAGQRSARLNRAYRVIYSETKEGELEVISVLEVNKHDY